MHSQLDLRTPQAQKQNCAANLSPNPKVVRSALDARRSGQGLPSVQAGEVALRRVVPLVDELEGLASFIADPVDGRVALQAARCVALLLQLHTSEYVRLGRPPIIQAVTGALQNGAMPLRKLVLKVLQVGRLHFMGTALNNLSPILPHLFAKSGR